MHTEEIGREACCCLPAEGTRDSTSSRYCLGAWVVQFHVSVFTEFCSDSDYPKECRRAAEEIARELGFDELLH